MNLLDIDEDITSQEISPPKDTCVKRLKDSSIFSFTFGILNIAKTTMDINKGIEINILIVFSSDFLNLTNLIIKITRRIRIRNSNIAIGNPWFTENAQKVKREIARLIILNMNIVLLFFLYQTNIPNDVIISIPLSINKVFAESVHGKP